MENIREWISRAFNLPILQRNRYRWVDYLRGVVILLVVYHHTYIGIQRSGISVPQSIADANMVFYSFRMPLFFIISGVFTSRSLLKQSVKSLVWVKYDKIFYPYLVWAFLQVSLQIALSNFTNSDRSFSDYLYILYQPRMLDQFWYLPALFNATLVFIFIKTRLKPKTGIHLLIGLAFYFTSPFLSSVSMLSDWMRFYVFFASGDAIANFVFNPKVQQQAKKPITLLLLLPVFVAAQIHYLNSDVGKQLMDVNPTDYFAANSGLYLLYEVNFLFIAFIGCATLVVLSFLMEKWNRLSFLRVLGFHSLYIYITHVIVVGAVRFLFTQVLHVYSPIAILLTGITLGVLVPVAFYNLLGRKLLWFLFSSKKETGRTPVQPKPSTAEALPVINGPLSPDLSGSLAVSSLGGNVQKDVRASDAGEKG